VSQVAAVLRSWEAALREPWGRPPASVNC